MPVAQLIAELLDPDREATDAEIRQLREHVARASFDPNARERVRGRGAGAVWRGRVLRGRDMLPPAEAHYVRHVLNRPEWPPGTSFDEYLNSVDSIIRDESGGVFLSRYSGLVQIGFVAVTGLWQGKEGHRWALVDFRYDIDHITTAYQIEYPDRVSEQEQRSDVRWLRRPVL